MDEKKIILLYHKEYYNIQLKHIQLLSPKISHVSHLRMSTTWILNYASFLQVSTTLTSLSIMYNLHKLSPLHNFYFSHDLRYLYTEQFLHFDSKVLGTPMIPYHQLSTMSSRVPQSPLCLSV